MRFIAFVFILLTSHGAFAQNVKSVAACITAPKSQLKACMKKHEEKTISREARNRALKAREKLEQRRYDFEQRLPAEQAEQNK
jgi:hypothetical protein